MKFTKFLLAILLSFVLFTILDIVTGTQIPIGIKSVDPIETSTHSNDEYLNEGEGAMHLVFTESTMSFVSTQPLSYYSMPQFYSRNMAINIMSSVLICLLLYFTRQLNMKKRLLSIFLFGMYSIVTIHAGYWNWWGFSTSYTIGVSIAFLISLVTVSFIISTLFIDSFSINLS